MVLYGENKELVKCYKCEYYHDKDEKYIEIEKTTQKWLCKTCRDFDTRTKQDLNIKTSFDKTQQIIIKDLAYRVKLLEQENQGQAAEIERLKNKKKV